VLLVLYANKIEIDGDVCKNGTFNSTLTWLLLPVPFEAELVLQYEFVSHNVLLQPDYYVLDQFFHGRFGGPILAPVPCDFDANWKVGKGLISGMY
jgi:hypothetical protein